MKYIPAEKLIVEIERRMKCYDRDGCEPNDGKWVELVTMKHFIDEQPEVDFEKAYKSYIGNRKDDVSGCAVTVNMKDLARHFYELGLNARK